MKNKDIKVNKGNIFFDIDSRLLFQLGEKLVTNRAVALAELVKNSYDADATLVIIHMKNIKKLGGKIMVEDNGLGMTFSTFKKTWMRIATTDKEENPISRKFKRKKAGEKGIGRFVCRRLSKKLTIKSVAENEKGQKEELNATFDWPTFAPGSDVDRIPINYNIKIVNKRTKTGTTLILEDTVESWNDSDVRRLRNELTELFSPVTFKPERKLKNTSKKYDPGFRIEFDCPEFPGKEKSLDKTFFKNAWAKLSGQVDGEGIATYEIKVTNKIINKIQRKFKRDSLFKYLRNVKLQIYIFSYRTDLFSGSEWSMSRSRKVGHERGGIKVYSDNFRVFGYGEKNDDWLKVDYDRARSLVGLDEEVDGYIEEDKRPGLRLFRNHSLFGHVTFIKNDNPMLEITVNRERLIGNESFEELRKFVRLGIDFATVIYSNQVYKEAEEKKKKKKDEEQKRKKAEEKARKKAEEERIKAEERAKKAEEERIKAEEERRKAEEERRRAEQEASRTTEDQAKLRVKEALRKEKSYLEVEEEARKKAEEARIRAVDKRKTAEEIQIEGIEKRQRIEEELIRLKEEKVRREAEKYKDEFSRLRVLAATGTLILIFEHELQALIEDMEEIINDFSLILKRLPRKEQKKYLDTLDSFNNRTEMIKELGELLGITIGKESRLEKKEWVLYPIVESVFRPFGWYLKDMGIDYSNTVPDNLRTPMMYRSELVSVLHNLMSNASKAVKGQQDRRIEVTGFEEHGITHIRFLDSGKGLDKALWEAVFEPFESYSEPDFRFGVGTGLGLGIARDIVRSYGGEVLFIKAPRGWKTCVEITLPMGG